MKALGIGSSLDEWLRYLEKQHPTLIELGLTRIEAVAKRANLLSFSCPIVMVAGTNGKGTIMSCLETIYTQAGYRVGAYTSPHLISYTERVRINSFPVSEQAMCKAFTYLQTFLQDISLSYFEYGTLAALWLFQQQPLDIILLEVGLGGRLDAVNIVEPSISVIATIDYDHQEWLGHTREEIGVEKAGIMRAAKPTVIMETDIPQSVLNYAEQLGTKLIRYQQDYFLELQNELAAWHDASFQYEFKKLPPIPAANLATAIEVVSLLQSSLPVHQEDMAAAVSKIRVPGRCQLIRSQPTVLVDVAHNPQSAQYLAEYVLKNFPHKKHYYVVWSMLADKDIPASISGFKDWVKAWYIAPLKNPRAASIEQLGQALKSAINKPVNAYSDLRLAYQAAVENVQEDDMIIVYGSFFTVAEILNVEQITPFVTVD